VIGRCVFFFYLQIIGCCVLDLEEKDVERKWSGSGNKGKDFELGIEERG
jgi:hypothetical protein